MLLTSAAPPPEKLLVSLRRKGSFAVVAAGAKESSSFWYSARKSGERSLVRPTAGSAAVATVSAEVGLDGDEVEEVLVGEILCEVAGPGDVLVARCAGTAEGDVGGAVRGFEGGGEAVEEVFVLIVSLGVFGVAADLEGEDLGFEVVHDVFGGGCVVGRVGCVAECVEDFDVGGFGEGEEGIEVRGGGDGDVGVVCGSAARAEAVDAESFEECEERFVVGAEEVGAVGEWEEVLHFDADAGEIGGDGGGGFGGIDVEGDFRGSGLRGGGGEGDDEREGEEGGQPD